MSTTEGEERHDEGDEKGADVEGELGRDVGRGATDLGGVTAGGDVELGSEGETEEEAFTPEGEGVGGAGGGATGTAAGREEEPER